MVTYTVKRSFSWRGKITDKTARLCRMFGISADRLRERSVVHSCSIRVKAGDIVYITGPSGSGKSVLLGELEKKISQKQRINLARIALPSDKNVIDCVETNLISSLRTLSVAGLNDVFCIIEQPAHLSEGQKYRYRLAMSLAAGKKYIIADEFCSNLDRITAAVIAHNIRKFALATGTVFLLASSCEDILIDLLPDVLVVKDIDGPAEVIYKNTERQYA